MNKRIKFKGKLGAFLNWPIIIAIILAMLNVGVYVYDIKSGVFVSAFIFIYTSSTAVVYGLHTPLIASEIVDFATQYSTVQKKLLNE